MAHHTATPITREMQECIDECLRCYSTCEATVTHCLDLGGKHAEREHIALLLDCARICQTSAEFMLHGSERHTRTCAMCAEVCRACAEDCERVDRTDEVMRRCAEECRRCADSCDRMAA